MCTEGTKEQAGPGREFQLRSVMMQEMLPCLFHTHFNSGIFPNEVSEEINPGNNPGIRPLPELPEEMVKRTLKVWKGLWEKAAHP